MIVIHIEDGNGDKKQQVRFYENNKKEEEIKNGQDVVMKVSISYYMKFGVFF